MSSTHPPAAVSTLPGVGDTAGQGLLRVLRRVPHPRGQRRRYTWTEPAPAAPRGTGPRDAGVPGRGVRTRGAGRGDAGAMKRWRCRRAPGAPRRDVPGHIPARCPLSRGCAAGGAGGAGRHSAVPPRGPGPAPRVEAGGGGGRAGACWAAWVGGRPPARRGAAAARRGWRTRVGGSATCIAQPAHRARGSQPESRRGVPAPQELPPGRDLRGRGAGGAELTPRNRVLAGSAPGALTPGKRSSVLTYPEVSGIPKGMLKEFRISTGANSFIQTVIIQITRYFFSSQCGLCGFIYDSVNN